MAILKIAITDQAVSQRHIEVIVSSTVRQGKAACSVGATKLGSIRNLFVLFCTLVPLFFLLHYDALCQSKKHASST